MDTPKALGLSIKLNEQGGKVLHRDPPKCPCKTVEKAKTIGVPAVGFQGPVIVCAICDHVYDWPRFLGPPEGGVK